MINIKTLKLILIIAFCSISSTIQAQTTKNIALSNKGPIVDELSFKEDAKDMGLTIKFLFDEDSNTLTVTLTSPKSLFVFWNDTRYKDVFSCHRWLLPEKLSYVVSSNTADSFRASKKFRKSLKRPRKKHLFKKWFEAEGLPPVEKELKLVNDSIVQTFSIADRRSTNFTFRLREILTMDEVQSKGTSRQYEFTTDKDFDIRYRITIHRNPCLGLDDEVAAAKGALATLTKNFESFLKKYASGCVPDNESLNTFQDTKSSLLSQFPKFKSTSLCPDIQQAREQYNLLLDSIQTIDVKIEAGAIVSSDEEQSEIDIQTILSNARQLDKMISRWLVSDDNIERADLLEECRFVISETTALIGNNEGQTQEERYAINLFKKAEQYFKKVVK